MNEIALILLVFGATLKLEEELQKRNPSNQLTRVFEKELVRFWRWRANPKLMDELRVIRLFAKNCAILSFWAFFLVGLVVGMLKLSRFPGLSILLGAIYVSFGLWGSLSWVIDHKGSLRELRWPVVFSIFAPWILFVPRLMGIPDIEVPPEVIAPLTALGLSGDPLLLVCVSTSMFMAFGLLISYPFLWLLCGIPVLCVLALLVVVSWASRAMLKVVTRKYHPYIYWSVAVGIGCIKYFKK